MSHDVRFRKSATEQYPIFCCISGEKTIECEGHTYRVDGYCKTNNDLYFLEFMGCRYGLKLFIFSLKI